jgi:hypothetical protein
VIPLFDFVTARSGVSVRLCLFGSSQPGLEIHCYFSSALGTVAQCLFLSRFLFYWSGGSVSQFEQELTSCIVSQINHSLFCPSAGQARSLFQVVAALGFSVDLGLAVMLLVLITIQPRR